LEYFSLPQYLNTPELRAFRDIRQSLAIATRFQSVDDSQGAYYKRVTNVVRKHLSIDKKTTPPILGVPLPEISTKTDREFIKLETIVSRTEINGKAL
jgi:hypothetical protein